MLKITLIKIQEHLENLRSFYELGKLYPTNGIVNSEYILYLFFIGLQDVINFEILRCHKNAFKYYGSVLKSWLIFMHYFYSHYKTDVTGKERAISIIT